MRLFIKKKVVALLDHLGENSKCLYQSVDYYRLIKSNLSSLRSISEIFQSEKNVDEILTELFGLEGLYKEMLERINRPYDLEQTSNQIAKKIELIKYSVSNNIKTEFEVVFFPYKLSMWDCMESVWREAMQDEDCKCYVVPIPYYKLNGNGIDSELCYEGNDFPKDVEVIHFSSYNLEEHHPDIIYFHNPYDEFNLVTRVKEMYFSYNLKKFTDMLVYIPYFVSGSYTSLDVIKRTAKMSGITHADRVIVQSDLQKQLMMQFGGYNPSKILPLGSPKFDATLRAVDLYSEIPVKWRKKLAGKKIFLWNTSIGTMLNSDNWLIQVMDIIEVFSQKKDCALIWRPHPLLEATIQSMRPQYGYPYCEIQKYVHSMSNAVIDNRSNSYISIGISDALISDYSSVMFQYCITGKPILSLTGSSSMRDKSIYLFDYFSNYFLNDGISVGSFCEMVRNNSDPKKTARLKAMKKTVLNADGSCGKNIHKEIIDEASRILLEHYVH